MMDYYLLGFIKENFITFYLLLTFLKGLALVTESVKDDAIVTLLYQAYAVLRTGKLPDEMGK